MDSETAREIRTIQDTLQRIEAASNEPLPDPLDERRREFEFMLLYQHARKRGCRMPVHGCGLSLEDPPDMPPETT